MLRKKANHLLFVLMVSLLILPYPTLGQKDKDKNKNLKTLSGAPVLWREPAEIESRNLLLGAGDQT